jgi:hypothetical protein
MNIVESVEEAAQKRSSSRADSTPSVEALVDDGRFQ